MNDMNEINLNNLVRDNLNDCKYSTEYSRALKLEMQGRLDELVEQFNGTTDYGCLSLVAQALNEQGRPDPELNQTVHSSMTAEGLCGSAIIHLDNGQLAASENQINKLLNMKDLDDISCVRAYYLMNCVYNTKGSIYDLKAASIQDRFFKHGKGHRSPEIRALYFKNKGCNEFNLGYLSKAIHCLKRAETEFISYGATGSYQIASVYYYLGLAVRDAEGYPEAIPYFKSSLKIGKIRKNQSLIGQSLEQLFFCYIHQGNVTEALALHNRILAFSNSFRSKLDSYLREAYLDIHRNNWKRARRKILLAYVEQKKIGLSRDAADIPFHLSYIYMKQALKAKAWRYIKNNFDPILRLQLLDIELHSGMVSNEESLRQFTQLASRFGVQKYLQKCSRLMNPSPIRELIYLDLEKSIIKFGNGKEINFSGKPVQRQFVCLLKEGKSFSKQELAQLVFNRQEYIPGDHDTAIYKLIRNLNMPTKPSKWILIKNGKAVVHPNIDIKFSDLVPRFVAHRELVLESFVDYPNQSLLQVARHSQLSRNNVRETLKSLVADGIVGSHGKTYYLREQVGVRPFLIAATTKRKV